MDDISRELPPDTTGATPVSERQKGPDELVRFERGQVDASVDDRDSSGGPTRPVDASVDAAALGGRLAGLVRHASSPLPEPEGMSDAARKPGEGASDDPEEVLASAERADPDEVEASEDLAMAAEDADGVEAVDDAVDVEAAAAAVAREADTASVEAGLEDLGDAELGEDGLPIVPELEDPEAIARTVFVLMLTSREGMSVLRLAQACNSSQKLVEQGIALLREQLAGLGLPVELRRVGDTVRWVSSAAAFPYLQRLRGVRKLEKLSPAALETLAVIAYQQPVMRSEIEAIRGVKAGPMLRTLMQHKLVRVTGRADVPGRPLQYGTTQQFLERFGLASLDELPTVKEWRNLG